MKAGKRKVDAEKVIITALDGEEIEFKREDVLDVSIISRKEGICNVEGKGEFKCRKIRGISSLV